LYRWLHDKALVVFIHLQHVRVGLATLDALSAEFVNHCKSLTSLIVAVPTAIYLPSSFFSFRKLC
jgi:hypothetical protein